MSQNIGLFSFWLRPASIKKSTCSHQSAMETTEIPRTIDIASLFRFPAADDGPGGAGGGADAETTSEQTATSTPRSTSLSMDDLPTEWRDALNQTSVMANSIRHLLQPGVPTAMDRDMGLWVALEEDIVSVSSDDSDDLDYGGDDDDIESISSGGSSDLSDGGYIVDEPNPFGTIVGKGKDQGSIVDDWTDDESAGSDISNWSDDKGKKKTKAKKGGKKKQAKKGAGPATGGNSSSSSQKKKVLVSSKSAGTQKQLSSFGIKMTITNKVNKTGDGGGDGGTKRKSAGATTSASTTKKKKRRKKKESAASTAAPNGKIRSELDKKPYAIGCAIVLKNLTGNDVVELNGKRGVVRSEISDNGTQEVEVNGQEGLIPMSLENMRGVCPLFG